MFEGAKCSREVVKLGSDALDLAIRADGNQVAVATLNGTVVFFDAHSCEQQGVGIEGKNDLGTVRYKNEVVDNKNRYFSTICYSVDGDFIIAGGKAKFICIYNVKEKLLVKKFEISNNLSLDGFQEFVSKRKIQEFGFNLAVIKHREDNSGLAPISLPGVMKSDYADREMTPVIAVHSVKFSPTMRSFSVASTEGVIIYSLDKSNVFDPFELDTSVTPQSLRKHLQSHNFSDALMHSLKLNVEHLFQETIESIPCDQINLIVSSLPLNYVKSMLLHIAKSLENTRHIEFYMKWVTQILFTHGAVLKNNIHSDELSSTLRHLHQIITRVYQDLNKICQFNKNQLKLLQLFAKHHQFSSMELELIEDKENFQKNDFLEDMEE